MSYTRGRVWTLFVKEVRFSFIVDKCSCLFPLDGRTKELSLLAELLNLLPLLSDAAIGLISSNLTPLLRAYICF